MARPVRKVVRIDRSPMNPRVWCIQLDCGHDVFVDGRKPRGKTRQCDKCGPEK